MLRTLAATAAVTLAAGLPATAPGAQSFDSPTHNSPHSVNFCAAKKGGGYDFAAQQIAMQSRGVLPINIINTAGSLEILAKLDSGECDAGIVQSDALPVYKDQNPRSNLTLEIGAPLYPELLHMICNKEAGLSKITGLTKDHVVFVGANGSGTSVTWNSFKLADRRYKAVTSYPLDGERAIGKITLGGENGTCMLYVAGLNSSDMVRANALAKQSGGKLTLVPTNDSDLLKLTIPGSKGTKMYESMDIPDGTYPNLQSGFLSSSVSTIAVTATFVANSKFVDGNGDEYDKLLTAVNNALPAIKKHVGAK